MGKQKLQEITSNLDNAKDDYQKFLGEDLKLKNLKDNISRITSNINSIEVDISNYTNEKSSIESSMYNLNEHLLVVNNLITLAKREFRGVLLYNIIDYINKKVKQYSRDVFGTDRLSFELNENYIDIKYDEKYFESLSGGEKQKIDIIIQLALKDLLSNQLNIHSNILVIDECFDFLDSIGCQKILDLLQKYCNDVESVFIISHHIQELNISYDNIIEVVKNDNSISNIYLR